MHENNNNIYLSHSLHLYSKSWHALYTPVFGTRCITYNLFFWNIFLCKKSLPYTHDIFCKIRPKEVFRVSVEWYPIEKLDVKNDVKNDIKNDVKNYVKNYVKNDVKNHVKNEVKNWDSFLRRFLCHF